MKRILCVFVVVGALAATSAATAAPSTVSGTFASTAPPATTCFLAVGASTVLCAEQPFAWTGGFDGTTVADLVLVFRPDGSSFGPAREVFTGTVAGVGTGTVVFAETATGDPLGNFRVDAVAVSGTGDLAGLHAHLVFVGACDAGGNCSGTYTGVIR
jgi:hypothetical protein